MPFRITVCKVDRTIVGSPQVIIAGMPGETCASPETIERLTQIFEQTVDTLDLPNFVLGLNKRTRVRKAKAAKE